MKKNRLLFFLLGLSFFSFIIVSPYGIDAPTPIEPFLNNVFPKESPSFGKWKVVNAYPNLTFVDPIAMEEIPTEAYFYIAGKQGFIWLVSTDENTTEKTVALDISELVITSEDAGMINFILHPEFSVAGSENEGVIFIYYAFHPTIKDGNNPRMNRLSKFKTFEGSLEIDSDSEFILMQDYDPQGWHMGGGMFFDNEGLLYLTTGDGGEGNDHFNSSQQIDQRLWGGILRIDVDNDATRSHPIRRQPIEYWGKPLDLPPTFTQGYMIPNDNPWQSEEGNILEEFYGLGLRSPHRAAFDSEDEKIWIADVGQAKREEIMVMPKGGNGQWPFKEGSVDGPRSRPEILIGEEVPPIFDYGRSEGVSIIGGFVYRGERWESYLEGLYLFAEFGTREIWSLNPATSEVVLLANVPATGVGGKASVSSFATNEEGDIFILKLFGQNLEGGVIYKLELDDAPNNTIPSLLSETGAFSDLENMTPAPGIIPYTVNSPLWSDGASKKRWIALANDGTHNSPEEQINFFENAEWQFPNGTVFIKHFELPTDINNPTQTQKVETRFFILDEKGRGYGLSYKWNETGTDAVLLESSDFQTFEFLDEIGQPQQQTWEYPSGTQCLNCHTANSGFVLGVNTWQLNGDLVYPSGILANQLETWNHLGMFADTLLEEAIPNFPQAVPLSNEFGLQDQISSYLASNCGHCHQPNGVESAFDARFNTPMAYKNIINAFGISHNNPIGGMIVTAGEPENSQLWIRDNSIEDNKMPPLAKTIIDEKYIDVLTEWIEGLAEDCNGSYLSNFEFADFPKNGILSAVKKDNLQDSIIIGEKRFEKGLGVNAFSKINYQVEEKFVQFHAYIGVNDAACDEAELIFEIYGDDEIKYRSHTMQKGEDARFICIDIEGVNTLTLVVKSPLEDNGLCNFGNWADAKLLRNKDTDGDGVCDDYDICPMADDRKDVNNDGIPDDCEKVDAGGTIEIVAFPNPFTEYVEILLEKPDPLIQKARLSVFDIYGRLLYQDFNVAYGQRYRIGNDWNSGVYILHVKSGGFENKVKIIKSK